MGVFSKVFKSRDSSRVRGRTTDDALKSATAAPQKYEDPWARKSVAYEEVQDLLHVCTQEVKSRALEMPFFLLPFRPFSDQSAAKNFIRNFFKGPTGKNPQYDGQKLSNELKLFEPLVLCSIMKWCWARLSGGVVTWNTYELFRVGELDSNMAKHAFDTLMPLSVESEAHRSIVFDFFDLLAAIAANGKSNGLGGRKLSRLAGWWAFDHPDTEKGFTGGYKSWASAADATSHLFFAYLRFLAPDGKPGTAGVSKIPRSLQALLSQTEYPPQTPELLLCRTSKVVMIVDSVSPTPYALLRRAKNFEYRDDDPTLQKFSEYSDPIGALTPECRRVLEAISTTNSTIYKMPETSNPVDASWSRFEDIGFSSLLDEPNSNNDASGYSRLSGSNDLRPSGASMQTNIGRPATPSWADFLSSGFADDASTRGPPSLLLPPDQILPPLSPGRVHSSQSHVKGLREDSLEPGELASVAQLDLDETFWWVWITSLAAEEPSERKGVFGRCAFVETDIIGGRWLVIEEQIRGAARPTEEALFVIEKRNRFSSFTKRGRTRRESTGKRPPVPNIPYQQKSSAIPQSRITVGSDQQAKVQAAAAALVQQKRNEDNPSEQIGRRRARTDEHADAKTTSVMTLQPIIMKEAGPAMQWARKFDKETVRQQYLGDNMAGRGSPTSSTLNLPTSLSAGDATALAQKGESGDRGIPSTTTPSEPTLDPAALKSAAAPPPPSEPVLPASTQESFTSPPQAPVLETRSIHAEPAIFAKPQTPITRNVAPVASTAAPVKTPPSRTIGRRPVNSVDSTTLGGPPYHQYSTSDLQGSTMPSKTSTEPSPAAIAANGAWVSQSSSPDSKKPNAAPQKSQKGNTRGLKSMFSKKKTAAPESLAAKKAMNGSTLSTEQPKLSRTPSFLRRKAAAEAQAAPQPAAQAAALQAAVPAAREPEVAAAPTLAPEPADFDGGEPGPVVTTDSYDHAGPTSSTVPAMIHPEANDSSARFSDFSQGPPEESPQHETSNAAMPDLQDSPPTSSAPQFNTLVAARLAPDQTAETSNGHDSMDYAASAGGYDTALESRGTTADPDTAMADDEESPRQSYTQSAIPATSVPSETEAADRWAQIRKNAADRRMSEEKSIATRARNQSESKSIATEKTDDGETSGEETIESRVARIKARVAELTGSSQQAAQPAAR